MKAQLLKCTILLVALFWTVSISAQAPDVSIGSPNGTADFDRTYNTGAYNEVTFVNEGGDQREREGCATTSSKVQGYSLSSSDSQWFDVYVPDGAASSIGRIVFMAVGNSTSTAGWEHQVWASTSSTFDLNRAYRIDFRYYGYRSGNCDLIDLPMPEGTKSIRIYRRVKTDDNGDGTYSLGDGDNTGSGQTTIFHSFDVYLITGPKIMDVAIAGANSDAIDHPAHTIHVTVPYATDLTNQTPLFTLAKGTSFINPADATTPKDFTNPVSYAVTDGNKNATYTVTVEKAPPTTCADIQLATFSVPFRGNTITGTINQTTKIISFNIPFTTTLAELQNDFAPTFAARATDLLCTAGLVSGCDPNSATVSGSVIDFSKSVATNPIDADNSAPAKIILMPQDGVACEYTVEITRRAADKNNMITAFSLGIVDENVQISGNTITVTVPTGAQYTAGGAVDYANMALDCCGTGKSISTNSLAATPIAIIPTDYSGAVGGTTPVTISVAAEDIAEPLREYQIIIIEDGTAPMFESSSLTTYDCSVAPTVADEVNSLAGVIKLLYDEAIVAGTGAITLVDEDATLLPLGTVTITDKEAKFNFSGLTSLTNYTLTISEGFFVDRYGNKVAETVICFRTADGTLKDFPFSGCMEGEDFAVPAFISGATYNDSVDTKATTPNQYGAYEIPAGGSLVINTEQAGTIAVNIYALGGNRNFTITTTSGKTVAGYLGNYENRGTSISLTIDEGSVGGTPFDISINNTGTGTIYVPFIYISENGQPAMTTNEACCK